MNTRLGKVIASCLTLGLAGCGDLLVDWGGGTVRIIDSGCTDCYGSVVVPGTVEEVWLDDPYYGYDDAYWYDGGDDYVDVDVEYEEEYDYGDDWYYYDDWDYYDDSYYDDYDDWYYDDGYYDDWWWDVDSWDY